MPTHHSAADVRAAPTANHARSRRTAAIRRALLALLVAPALGRPLPAQSSLLTLSGPSVVDFSQLPRLPSGEYVVLFTGTGFAAPMLLAATIGPVGPWIVPHLVIDDRRLAVAVPQPVAALVSLQLFRLGGANEVIATPRLAVRFVPGPPSGSTFYVATNGADTNPGTLAAPFRTIGRGIQALAPGATLQVRGGLYLEQPVVNVSGTPAQPITIQSYPGERAVIDSGPAGFRLAGNSDWELVDAATGEYRSMGPAPAGTPYGYVTGVPGYENERVGLVPYVNRDAFRSISEAYTNRHRQFYVGPGLFRDDRTGRLHVRLQKTAELRYVESRYGQVFAADTPDPRTLSILVSQAPATLTVLGSHLVIKDLTVHQALNTISLPATVTDVRFEGVEAWLGDSAIQSTGPGSSGIVITRCRVYGDVPRWIFWTDAKEPPAPADRMRQTSIDFANRARDVHIAYNHVRGGHDLIGVNTDEDRFFIHHNVLMNCHDDAAELEGTTDIGRIEFHDNYVVNALVAVAPGQDSPATRGPILVFNNVFADLRTPPINREPGIVGWNGGGHYGFEYMLKQHSGNTFYYHNTMVQLDHSGRGINLVPVRPAGTWCANNILVMVNGRVNGAYATAPGQIVDGNLYWKVNTLDSTPLADLCETIDQLYEVTGLEPHGIGSVPMRGTDPGFAAFQLGVLDPGGEALVIDADSEQWPITAFLLSATSAARAAGIALTVHPVFGMLPGANVSRDVGALAAGHGPAAWSAFPFDQVR